MRNPIASETATPQEGADYGPGALGPYKNPNQVGGWISCLIASRRARDHEPNRRGRCSARGSVHRFGACNVRTVINVYPGSGRCTADCHKRSARITARVLWHVMLTRAHLA